MSLRKQIDALNVKRNKHLDAMTAASELAAGENRLFTEDEQKAFDTDQAEVRDIDAQLVRLVEAEKQLAARATPAPSPLAPTPTPGVEVKPFKAFAGQGFVRMTIAIARAKGDYAMAANIAEQWKDQTPEVGAVLRAIAGTGQMPGEVFRAAVAAGTTVNPTWAAPLVYAQNLSSEFIELLRNASIIGKLPLVPVPFNASIPRQTGGAAAGWVGEGVSIPVQGLTFDRLPIPFTKFAVISVITRELMLHSDPAAEQLVRNDLVASIAENADKQFIDPSVAASAGVRPASITNGLTAIASTGSTVAEVTADLTAALKKLAAANMPMTGARWIMTPAARITLENLRTTQEIKAFPEVSQGMLLGYPIVESNSVPTDVSTTTTTCIVLADCSQILHAADPVVDISVSEEAALQMDSAPATPATPLMSLWQQGMVGIRSIQQQYWVKRRDNCVAYISGFVVG